MRSARKVVELTNEANHLTELNARLQTRVDELKNGQTIVALGQQLMALRDQNEQMAVAARRLWLLDRTLCAAPRM